MKEQPMTKDQSVSKAKKLEPASPAETDHAATHNDEFAGQGGSYEIVDGKRRLVERTQPPAEEAVSGKSEDKRSPTWPTV
jgi:hypothetical protein